MTAAAIQTAIYSALSGDAALAALVSGVYDHADQDTAFPYVTIGEDTLRPWDDKGVDGFEATITLHSWSRHRGREEVKDIQAAIYAVLHNGALSVSGYDAVLILLDFEDSFLDQDGLTRHGVSRYRLLTAET